MVWWTSAARIGSELAMRAPISAGRRQQDERDAGAARDALPEDQDPGAEDERDQQPAATCWPAGRPAASRKAALTQSQASSQAAASSRKKESRAAPSEPAMPISRIHGGGMRADEQDRRRRAPARCGEHRSQPQPRGQARRSATVSHRRERRRHRASAAARPQCRSQREDDGQRRLPGKLDAAHAGRAPIERSTSAADDADDHHQQGRHQPSRRPAPTRCRWSGCSRSRTAAWRRCRRPRRSAVRRRWRRPGSRRSPPSSR